MRLTDEREKSIRNTVNSVDDGVDVAEIGVIGDIRFVGSMYFTPIMFTAVC